MFSLWSMYTSIHVFMYILTHVYNNTVYTTLHIYIYTYVHIYKIMLLFHFQFWETIYCIFLIFIYNSKVSLNIFES